MTKCNSEAVAQSLAAKHGNLYGVCPFDGKFYVGSRADLEKLDCLRISLPNGVAVEDVERRDYPGISTAIDLDAKGGA